MLRDEFPDDADDWGYYHARQKIRNRDLQKKYDEMHKQGATAWYGDGREERETILKMGEPWKGLNVLEIGCGEGELLYEIAKKGADVLLGVDYSQKAIDKARKKYPRLRNRFKTATYKHVYAPITEVLVMQGVLEHLDDPFGELQWMIEHFKPKTVITSSPCFLNPRGIVWMTLDMLGAVMSKTDLHYIDPDNVKQWCKQKGYFLKMESCDYDWGNGIPMLQDLRQRIPLALKDGNIPFELDNVVSLINWLGDHMAELATDMGATMVYRIEV